MLCVLDAPTTDMFFKRKELTMTTHLFDSTSQFIVWHKTLAIPVFGGKIQKLERKSFVEVGDDDDDDDNKQQTATTTEI